MILIRGRIRRPRVLQNAIPGLVGAAIGLILLLPLSIRSTGLSIATLLLALSCAICIGALVQSLFNKSPRPLLLTYLLYMIFFYEIPGIIHVSRNQFPWAISEYPERYKILAAGVTLLFSVFVLVGYGIYSKIKPSFRKFTPAPKSHQFIPIVVGLAGVSAFCALLIGFAQLHTARGAESLILFQLTPLNLIEITIAKIGGFLALIFACVCFCQRMNSLRSIGLVILSAAVFIATNNILALPRYVVGAYLLTFFFIFFRPSRAKRTALAVCLFVGQFTLFPLLSDLSRGSGLGLIPNPIEYLTKNGDFDGFQSTINVVQMVDDQGLSWGRGILSAVLFFVPRDLFPSKSPGTGLEAAANAGYDFINISSPAPAEFYVDFGLVGVVLLCLAVGYGMAKLDSIYANAVRNGDLVERILPAVVAGYVFIVFRGTLVAVLGPLALATGLTVIAIYFLRKGATLRRPRRGVIAKHAV